MKQEKKQKSTTQQHTPGIDQASCASKSEKPNTFDAILDTPVPNGNRLGGTCAFVCVMLLVAFVFWRGCLNDYFAQDDFLFLEKAMLDLKAYGLWGTLVRSVVNVGAVDNGYRPLSTTIYFSLMYHLFGLKSFWYHLFNLLLHTGNALLIYAVASRLTKNFWWSVFGAFFFLTRSMGYVSVYWASGIQELAACFFSLAFAWCVIHSVQTSSQRWLGVASLAFAAGVHAKEICFLLPFCVPLLWLAAAPVDWQKTRRRCLLITGAFLVEGAVFAGIRIAVRHGYESPYQLSEAGLGMLTDALTVWIKITAWNIVGKWEVPFAWLCVFAALIVLLVIAPLLQDVFRQAYGRGKIGLPALQPLALLCAGTTVAVPLLLLSDRLVQYYAYVPGAFTTLAIASAGSLLTLPNLRFQKIVLRIVLAGLVASMVYEYDVSGRKDQFQLWSGGFMNTYARMAFGNLNANMKKVIGKVGAETPILIVGWRELYVASNLRTGDSTLTGHSFTESMLNLLYESGNAPYKILLPTPSLPENTDLTRHHVLLNDLEAYLPAVQHKGLVVFVNFAGHIMQIVPMRNHSLNSLLTVMGRYVTPRP